MCFPNSHDQSFDAWKYNQGRWQSRRRSSTYGYVYKESSIPQEYVVVCDDSREQSEQLKYIVEITWNHPFLKSCIELIDSPGRNKNNALDGVVDEFFEKGTTPLVVYVIDGNEQLRQTVSTKYGLNIIDLPH